MSRTQARWRAAGLPGRADSLGKIVPKGGEWAKVGNMAKDKPQASTSEGGDMSNENIRELFIEELAEVQGGTADSGISASLMTTQACCEEFYDPRQCCL